MLFNMFHSGASYTVIVRRYTCITSIRFFLLEDMPLTCKKAQKFNYKVLLSKFMNPSLTFQIKLYSHALVKIYSYLGYYDSLTF